MISAAAIFILFIFIYRKCKNTVPHPQQNPSTTIATAEPAQATDQEQHVERGMELVPRDREHLPNWRYFDRALQLTQSVDPGRDHPRTILGEARAEGTNG